LGAIYRCPGTPISSAVGYLPTFVAVPGDPLKDISMLAHVEIVTKGCTAVSGAAMPGRPKTPVRECFYPVCARFGKSESWQLPQLAFLLFPLGL
jgi:hypothetical protein